jgi:siroheme synthase
VPTLIILMGVKRLTAISAALIATGREPDTPAAAISWGTTDRQQVVRATLATLPEVLASSPLPTPAVVVIGEVVTLAEELAWFQPDGSAPGFISMA